MGQQQPQGNARPPGLTGAAAQAWQGTGAQGQQPVSMGTGNIPVGAQSYGGGITPTPPMAGAGGVDPSHGTMPPNSAAGAQAAQAKNGATPPRTPQPTPAQASAAASAPQRAAADKATAQAPTYQQGLDAQYGQGNPFGQRPEGVQGSLDVGRGVAEDVAPKQDWYGGNPLETAQAVAQRFLGAQLGDIRNRYAQAGVGPSSRSMLAQGQAIADTTTGLGDVLAQRGQQAYQSDMERRLNSILGIGNLAESGYQNDANRGLSADLGAAANQNQRDQLALMLNQQLGNLGIGLTGIGAQEQGIPNLGEMLSFLGEFQKVFGKGGSASRGASGFGWKS